MERAFVKYIVFGFCLKKIHIFQGHDFGGFFPSTRQPHRITNYVHFIRGFLPPARLSHVCKLNFSPEALTTSIQSNRI
jgi:hypothetical protein